MSSPIILGLVLMWAVVLIPMWLRRHDEAEETRSIDRFSDAMRTLSRREGQSRRETPVRHESRTPEEAYRVMPSRSRSIDVHVSGASAPQPKAAVTRPKASATPLETASPRTARPAPRVGVTAAQRRRRTLLGLFSLAVVMLIAAVVTASPIAWVVEVLVDLLLVAFVVYLRRMAIASTSVRRARPAPARRVVTESATPRRAPTTAERQQQRRWEQQRTDVGDHEEHVTVHYVQLGQTAAAVNDYAEPVFDSYDDQYEDEQYGDTRYDEERFEEELPADVTSEALFDQESYGEPEPSVAEQMVEEQAVVAEDETHSRSASAGFMESGVIKGRRDDPIEVAESAVETRPERAAGIGGTPWEPVPVPRPTYTMKPPAPPRRAKYEPGEPLLPPVETAAELDPVDELEEILDRRWAVND